MTRRVLEVLADLRPSASGCALLIVGLPILVLAVLADGLLRLLDARREARVRALGHVRCPRGHLIDLSGDDVRFACATCGLPTATGFGRCVHCGSRNAAIRCACGEVARSPTWSPGEAS